MPLASNTFFKSLIFNRSQDATKECDRIVQDEPISPKEEKPVADFNSHSPVAEDSDSLPLDENNAHDSRAEAVAPTLKDDNRIETENTEFEIITASDICPLPEEPIADSFPNSIGDIRRRTRVSTDGDANSSTEETRHTNGLDSTGDSSLIKGEKPVKLTEMKLFLFDSTTSILGVFFPFLTICFGLENMGKCPANLYLPYMVFVMGVLGLLIVCYALVKTSGDNFDKLAASERALIEVSACFLATLWMCEVSQFFKMSVSFDRPAENYCDLWFYIFTILMNLFVVLAYVIGLSLLYLEPADYNPDRRPTKIPRGPHEWLLMDSSDSD